jgi:hypothetical protein
MHVPCPFSGNPDGPVRAVGSWHYWLACVARHIAATFTMGGVGFTALAANAASFGLLWSHRRGDANMRSAWICTRNDVLGNLAVLLAALLRARAGPTCSWRRSWRA